MWRCARGIFRLGLVNVVLSQFLFGSVVGHASSGGECERELYFIQIYICQGHSVFKTALPDAQGDPQHLFRGFYPHGRIADELGESLYKSSDFDKCQSVCLSLSSEKAEQLKIDMHKIEKRTENGEDIKKRIGRDAYHVMRFNCVDFSNALFQRYFNTSIVNEFKHQGRPLRIFCDPLEPCFGGRNQANCLEIGADKAAIWAYYREGILPLLKQMAQEKPLDFLLAVSANAFSLGTCFLSTKDPAKCFAAMSTIGLAFTIPHFFKTNIFSSVLGILPQVIQQTIYAAAKVSSEPFLPVYTLPTQFFYSIVAGFGLATVPILLQNNYMPVIYVACSAAFWVCNKPDDLEYVFGGLQ